MNVTGEFLAALVFLVVCIYLVIRFAQDWQTSQLEKLLLLIVFGGLAVLTVRTTYRASFINYDNAKEFLVYAHAARGPKDILEQIEEISYRTTGGKDILVAYDNDGLYPYWWYLRDYPNHSFYGEKPTRSLRDYAMVIVSESNYGTAEPIFSNEYVFDRLHALVVADDGLLQRVPWRVPGMPSRTRPCALPSSRSGLIVTIRNTRP